MFRVTGLILALILAAACSDDDNGGTTQDTGGGTGDQSVYDLGQTPDNGGTQQDQGPPTEQGVNKDGPITTKDGPVTTKDGPVTTKDGPIAKDTGPQTDYGAGTKPNTGVACTPPQNVCPHKQDECIIVSGGNQNKGMCLIKCTTKGAACPTDNPATQKSICFLDFTGPPAETYCAYMCKYQGQTYACPVGSTCKAIPGSTTTSICVQQ
jgi:hypothetical protein